MISHLAPSTATHRRLSGYTLPGVDEEVTVEPKMRRKHTTGSIKSTEPADAACDERKKVVTGQQQQQAKPREAAQKYKRPPAPLSPISNPSPPPINVTKEPLQSVTQEPPQRPSTLIERKAPSGSTHSAEQHKISTGRLRPSDLTGSRASQNIVSTSSNVEMPTSSQRSKAKGLQPDNLAGPSLKSNAGGEHESGGIKPLTSNQIFSHNDLYSNQPTATTVPPQTLPSHGKHEQATESQSSAGNKLDSQVKRYLNCICLLI